MPIINTFYCYGDQDVQSCIICVNRSLYFKDEEVALMLTFQSRASRAVVRNIPKQFEKNSPLSISFPGQYLSIPFLIKITTCYIPLRTLNEVEVNSLARFNLTSPNKNWDISSS